MNKAILIGRLTRDPELKFTAGSGTAVASFTLAVDRQFKNKDGQKEADFINCVAWNKTAETISNYLKKGSLIAASGRIQTRTYDNNEGKKVYVTEVIVEDFQFLDSKDKAGTNNNQQGSNTGKNNTPQNEDFFPLDDSEIPF
jgi:single-strand DNA-binding protein